MKNNNRWEATLRFGKRLGYALMVFIPFMILTFGIGLKCFYVSPVVPCGVSVLGFLTLTGVDMLRDYLGLS